MSRTPRTRESSPSKSPNRRTFLRLGVVSLSTIAVAGCSDSSASADHTIGMSDDLGFDPKTTTIEPGTTVTWTNTSDVDHTVTAYGDRIPPTASYFASGGFDSERAAKNRVVEGLIPPSEAYEHRFEEPGTYDYYCLPHENAGMVGTVEVG